MQKDEHPPHVKALLMARRCGARARSIKHQPCRQPAMLNGRCRLHGGLSTGPKTQQGKKRAAMANFKHGLYSQGAIAARKQMREMMQWRNELADI